MKYYRPAVQSHFYHNGLYIEEELGILILTCFMSFIRTLDPIPDSKICAPPPDDVILGKCLWDLCKKYEEICGKYEDIS